MTAVAAVAFSGKAVIIKIAYRYGVLLHFLIVQDTSSLSTQPIPVYGLALLMAVISTVLPVVLTSIGIRRLGSNNVALIGTIGPVATMFLGHSFLDESITLIQLSGVVVIGLKRESVRPIEVAT